MHDVWNNKQSAFLFQVLMKIFQQGIKVCSIHIYFIILFGDNLLNVYIAVGF